ncbi:MAG: hypothetical protein ACOX4G_15140 [Limnochordia bacterium]
MYIGESALLAMKVKHHRQ